MSDPTEAGSRIERFRIDETYCEVTYRHPGDGQVDEAVRITWGIEDGKHAEVSRQYGQYRPDGTIDWSP